jgi:formylglycine-generating enzyme
MAEDSTTHAAARRTGWIIAGIFLAGIALAITWVAREAMRIKNDRDRTRAEERTGSAMVLVRASAGFRGFTMGANDGEPDERPLHDVKVSDFWMDRTEVTNDQFARFVAATRHVTTAEKPSAERPAGSWVFRDGKKMWLAGANWRVPGGPGTSIEGRGNFPVVHISHDDATACAIWAGKRLPTEAEWEFAVRGGVELSRYPWGAEPAPGGRWNANVRQGENEDTGADGFAGLAPVGSYIANAFDIADLAGNAAEWCADWYAHDYYAQLRPDPDKSAHRNPRGPEVGNDPLTPGLWKRVVRGGSWISGELEYRCAARAREAPDFTADWLGFRCVKDAK